MSHGQRPGFDPPGHGPPGGDDGVGQRPPYGQPSYGQPSYGEPPYGKPAYGQAASAQPAHGRGRLPGRRQPGAPPPHYGAAPYGSAQEPAPYGSAQEWAQYGQAPQYGQAAPYAPPYPAPPRPASETGAEASAGGPVSDEDERWAVPAYVGMFVVGFLAPLIVYLAKGRSSKFARFHAAQALNLSVALTVCTIITLVFVYQVGFSALPVAVLAAAFECFFIVKAAIGANRCDWYRLPAILAWPIFR